MLGDLVDVRESRGRLHKAQDPSVRIEYRPHRVGVALSGWVVFLNPEVVEGIGDCGDECGVGLGERDALVAFTQRSPRVSPQPLGLVHDPILDVGVQVGVRPGDHCMVAPHDAFQRSVGIECPDLVAVVWSDDHEVSPHEAGNVVVEDDRHDAYPVAAVHSVSLGAEERAKSRLLLSFGSVQLVKVLATVQPILPRIANDGLRNALTRQDPTRRQSHLGVPVDQSLQREGTAKVSAVVEDRETAALPGCAILDALDRSSSFHIRVSGSGSGSHPETGEVILLNNSLDDFRGLAGLEIELFGLDIPDKITAADLGENWETRVFDVPTSGTARAVLTLMGEDGTAVAQGSGSWLNSEGVDWHLTITRGPIPFEVNIRPDGSTQCWWWWCAQAWGLTIREDEQNYPSEMLWVMLYGVVRGECADLC